MIGDLISNFAKWLLDLFLWIPRKVFALICDGLATLLEAIPVPDFVSNAASAFGAISGHVWFFASAFEIQAGVSIVLSAYVLRFAIRRLPIVG